MSKSTVTPLTFECRGESLMGLLHAPDEAAGNAAELGIVVVVGGPQYRVGSHRQFVLLARDLCNAGYPVLRFDYRGMGDSGGDYPGEADYVGLGTIDDDIRAAIDTLVERHRGVRRVALWGLCDAASAIAFYASRDPRVAGIALLNPWVRTEAGLAQTHLRHHYGRRALSAEFWRRVRRGEVDLVRSSREFAATTWTWLRQAAARFIAGGPTEAFEDAPDLPLPERVLRALRRYRGRVLVILSGQDVTGSEFDRMVLARPAMAEWARRPEVAVERMDAANHTYSRAVWREQVHTWTRDWLVELGRGQAPRPDPRGPDARGPDARARARRYRVRGSSG